MNNKTGSECGEVPEPNDISDIAVLRPSRGGREYSHYLVRFALRDK